MAEESPERGSTAEVRGCSNIVSTYVMIDGRHSDVQVPLQQIASSPSWNPSNGEEIPLSVTQAFRLATSEFQRHFGDRDNWRLEQLHLRPLCDDLWVYLFLYSPTTRGETGVAAVVVLMSGEVVPLDTAVPGRWAMAEESPERARTAEVIGCHNIVNTIAWIDGRHSQGELVPLEQIASSPAWNPSKGEEIPLSVTEAFRLATSELQRYVGGRENWALEGLALRPLCDDRWAYSFSFLPMTRGEIGLVNVGVLMSGEVVPLAVPDR